MLWHIVSPEGSETAGLPPRFPLQGLACRPSSTRSLGGGRSEVPWLHLQPRSGDGTVTALEVVPSAASAPVPSTLHPHDSGPDPQLHEAVAGSGDPAVALRGDTGLGRGGE